MVLDLFMAVWRATLCLFCDILAPLPGLSLELQVDDFATTLPFLGPEVQRKPCFNPLPLTLLNTLLIPSAIPEVIVAVVFDTTTSCGTTSCGFDELMALDKLDCKISEIFISVFMVPTDRIQP